MNKKVICIIVCVVICVLAGIGISSYEKRKKDDLKTKPMDEGISSEESINTVEQQTETVDSENQPVESMESTDSNLTLMVDGSISLEVLSNEILDDTEIEDERVKCLFQCIAAKGLGSNCRVVLKEEMILYFNRYNRFKNRAVRASFKGLSTRVTF